MAEAGVQLWAAPMRSWAAVSWAGPPVAVRFYFVLFNCFSQFWCTISKIGNSSFIDPNDVVLILLGSWSCLVFNKNII